MYVIHSAKATVGPTVYDALLGCATYFQGVTMYEHTVRK